MIRNKDDEMMRKREGGHDGKQEWKRIRKRNRKGLEKDEKMMRKNDEKKGRGTL